MNICFVGWRNIHPWLVRPPPSSVRRLLCGTAGSLALSLPPCVCVCVCGPYSRRWIQPFYLSLCLVSSPRKGAIASDLHPQKRATEAFLGAHKGLWGPAVKRLLFECTVTVQFSVQIGWFQLMIKCTLAQIVCQMILLEDSMWEKWNDCTGTLFCDEKIGKPSPYCECYVLACWTI